MDDAVAANDFLARLGPAPAAELERLGVKALRALRQLGWIDSRGRDITITDPEQVRRRAVH